MISRFAKGLGQSLRQLFYLFGKVGLVLLLSVGLGLGWAYFLFGSQKFSIAIIKLAVVVGSGIGSGLLARLILQRHTFVLRWLSAWFSLGTCLLYLNELTLGKTGFSFFQSQSPNINWEGLWQLLLGGIVTCLTLFVWKKKNRSQPLLAHGLPSSAQALPRDPVEHAAQNTKKKPARTTKKEGRHTSTPGQIKSTSSLHRSTGPKLKQPAAGREIKQSATQNSLPKPLKLQRPAKPGQKLAERPMAISRPRRSKGRRAPIRLVGQEEHRCPFCLTLVDPLDPAGVVVCPICHSYHHKSCWEVTGTCQVPHLHS